MKNKTAFNIVQKHINNWDCWGLLSGGAPLDEYKLEITCIVNALPQIKNHLDLANKIKGVFDKAFGEEHSIEECIKISVAIWEEFMKEKNTIFFS
ncbi:DUF1871 family protein [Cytobacillus sp. IB215316]|uniref:DUF1871 family protein n=1 Tax=Cytobacillus sp. IB215316 TaxID=3097354 RepID=UPI002A11B8D2|nr:DUF1871 family protein [Cytobacillus sp. IB215316]MDX8363358.1 DUF1871 family protein [Cytobacillus sp. IB215316]